MISGLKIISITHKKFTPEQIGWMYIDQKDTKHRLEAAKTKLSLNELMYLNTCNRVEVILIQEKEPKSFDLKKYLKAFNPALKEEQLETLLVHCEIYEQERAVNHLFRVASSLDSMVVGEREIITQVKNAYKHCLSLGLTGDSVRILIQKTIETAKRVYTETNISKNPVSVVSLAFEQLNKKIDSYENKKIVLVGAGQTITSFSKMLKKKGAVNVSTFNRTLKNAKRIAKQFTNGKSYLLNELNKSTAGFDILVSCTGSDNSIIGDSFLKNHTNKHLVDLAVPYDIDRVTAQKYKHNLVGMETLKKLSTANIEKRKLEIKNCERIILEQEIILDTSFRERKVEIAMSNVPKEIKLIKNKAINQVFAKDIEQFDDTTKEVLDKILNYVEKKYISGPMKMAKEILMDRNSVT